LAALNYRHIKAVRHTEPKSISFYEIKKAMRSLLHNKQYLMFTGTAIFFYMTWHFDWTLYFIGQVNYLKMNEFLVGLTALGATAAQFLTMRFWSRRNEKHGVVLPVTFGILGLSLCPVAMITAVSMPSSIAPYAFLIFHFAASLPLATVTLNMLQCLLQVADEEYRSFSISIFTCLVCLSNAVMPVAGIALYHALGDDLNGLRYTFAIIFVLRIIAACFWLLRRHKTQESVN
jgi:MFS family permease